MTYVITAFSGSINLQPTLAAASPQSPPTQAPHHPISCTSRLFLHEDGAFECEHGRVPADDPRTQACLDHSIAILLIELLAEREGRLDVSG